LANEKKKECLTNEMDTSFLLLVLEEDGKWKTKEAESYKVKSKK